ncbi:MAG: hypothetical protein MZU91_00965 [Desulfosudis oleivorans]|nr:hypothetical protein [Desulfosudis oleivorans]
MQRLRAALPDRAKFCPACGQKKAEIRPSIPEHIRAERQCSLPAIKKGKNFFSLLFTELNTIPWMMLFARSPDRLLQSELP